MKLKNKIQSWEIDGAAYPERSHLRVTGTPEAIMEIRTFMESSKPAGIPCYINSQASAWLAVCKALDAVSPGWLDGAGVVSGMDLAVAAINGLAGVARQESEEHTITIDGVTLIARGPQGCGKTRMLDRIQEFLETPKAKPLQFDLDAAKAGAAIQTRDGRKARFVAHVPEAAISGQVIVLIEGDNHVTVFGLDGEQDCYHGLPERLFMAPKPKKTVYVNLFRGGFKEWRMHFTAEDAEAEAGRSRLPMTVQAMAIAVPIEIDA